MVYWLNRDAAQDVAATMNALLPYGKPLMPVGQAYNALPEGGPPGVPKASDIQRFMKTSEDMGATAVSFWSWQEADQQAWDGIRDAPFFTLPAAPTQMSMGTINGYRSLLTSLGFPAGNYGYGWDAPATAAVTAYQKAAKLAVTGVIDEATRDALLTPFGAPIQPMP
jgi:peptidoglycan hydrolase-like protein with peptidoglycan-binding domain